MTPPGEKQRSHIYKQPGQTVKAAGLARTMSGALDTDKWLNTTWQPDATTVRSAFFGRVIRVLAEDLSTAAVVAIHPTYLADAEYQSAAGFLDTTIHMPAIPSPAAVAQILGRRAGLALDSATGQFLLALDNPSSSGDILPSWVTVR
jgi:hypothetical protein